jgi:hypothetical protein
MSSVPHAGHQPDEPWFTGPLLTPSARVIPKGHVNMEPYVFWTVSTGRYNKHWKADTIPTFNQMIFQLQGKIGVLDRLDISFAPQSIVSFTRGKSGSSIGDLPIGVDYQLFKGEPDDWITYAKLSFMEIFPTGKFQKLHTRQLGTDAGGQGCYISMLGLTLSKLFKFGPQRFLGTRCNFTAAYSAPRHVHGLNVYGGDKTTRGKVFPGTSFVFMAGAEYTVTKEFSLACDFQALYFPKSKFKGFSTIPVFDPEFISFSLAPALEYNWNSSMGIIIGAWFSFAGRNSNRFINGVAAFNYSY